MPNTRGVKRSRDEEGNEEEKLLVIENKGAWSADKASASPPAAPSASSSARSASPSLVATIAPLSHDLEAYQLRWQRFGTLLVLDSHSSATARIPGSSRIAAFDMDSTLIAPKSGRRFPLHRGDWRWLHPEVPLKLKQLYRDGWKLVIFTNQRGISTGQTTAAAITGKISDIIEHLDCPVQAFVATADDLFRKPATNMWAKFIHDHNAHVPVDLHASVYVGDAAGRQKGWDGNAATKKDHSAADRKFAMNVGIRFATPEPYFLGHKEAEYKLDSLDIASFFTRPASKKQRMEDREVEEAKSEGEDQVQDEKEEEEEEKVKEEDDKAVVASTSKASVTVVSTSTDSSSAATVTQTVTQKTVTITTAGSPSAAGSSSSSSSSAALHAKPHQELVLFVGLPASGKCFARGTRLRLFNGDTIAVEDIVGGEQLMGDDGLARIVTPGSLIHHVPRAVSDGSEDRSEMDQQEKGEKEEGGQDGGAEEEEGEQETEGEEREEEAEGEEAEEDGSCDSSLSLLDDCDDAMERMEGGKEGERRNGEEGEIGAEGKNSLYRITPNRDARPFTVNGAHILVLSNNSKPQPSKRISQPSSGRTAAWQVVEWEVTTDNRMVLECRGTYATKALAQAEVNRRLAAGWEPLEWEVSVEELLRATPGARSRCKLIGCKAITFVNPLLPSLHHVLTTALGVAPTAAQVEYMAWWLGIWLTNGLEEHPSISQGGALPTDQHHQRHTFARLLDYERLFNQSVRQMHHSMSRAGWPVYLFSYELDSVADRVLRAYGLINNKHVPRALICDSMDVRRRLLAGLIDGDGCYNSGNVYELAAEHRPKMDGYKELAATLGLRNSVVRARLNNNQQTGEQYRGYRITLAGDMWGVVQHCVATYRQCPQPGAPGYAGKSQDNRYGFTVTELAEGEYFGFAVHGGINRRFLLDDYTVTHNVSRTTHCTHPTQPITALIS